MNYKVLTVMGILALCIGVYSELPNWTSTSFLLLSLSIAIQLNKSNKI